MRPRKSEIALDHQTALTAQGTTDRSRARLEGKKMSSSQQLGNHNETRCRNYITEPIPLKLQLQDGRSGVLRPVDMVAVNTFNH
jgi:hypothetical protein